MSFRLFDRKIHSEFQKSLALRRQKAFVNDQWVTAESKETFSVRNPHDGSVLACVPDMAEVDTGKAVDAAYAAFLKWKNITAKERGTMLRNWFELLQDNFDEITKIISMEAGKPRNEALGEVMYGNSFIEWFSEEARRIHGDVLCSPASSKEMILIKQPIGVVGLITPWNFPHAMITRKVGAALAAGCTCVVKPAEDTPLTALLLADFAQKAGIPKGVINVVTASRNNAASIGKVLCQHPHVAGISFTGSTNVGKILYKQCSEGVKRIALELGGNAPFIVFDSANLDNAVQGAMAAKFRNAGQTCVSANRFLIHCDVFDEFVSKLKTKMQTLHMGDPSSSDVTIGPLINVSQATKVKSIVDDAVQKGAEVCLGGKPAMLVGECYFEPTLLVNVNPSMSCYKEEIFGPVVICVKFSSEEEALSISNDTKSGLAGYFYTNDIGQAWRVAKALDVGMVGINEGLISTAEAAFGGIKESGLGREGSHYGTDEFTYIKYLCFGGLN